jgi:sugar phosphate permease
VPPPTFLRGRVRWILIGWMFGISAIAYLDRVNISITGSLIEEDFHLTDIQLGWVFSAFVLGYALSKAPGGRTADRFGPRRVVTIGGHLVPDAGARHCQRHHLCGSGRGSGVDVFDARHAG